MKIFTFLASLFLYQIAAKIQSINQITNSKFTNPGLPSSRLSKVYNGSIEGWTCSSFCQILNCTRLGAYYPTVNQTSLQCSGYTIDLNSASINEELSQILSLSFQYYWLQLDYLYPQYNAKFKQLQIIFNEEVLFSLKPNILFSIQRYQFKMRVNGKDGINKLSFKQLGYQLDGTGFKIANTTLNREYNEALQNTMSYFFQLQFLKKGSEIPGGRIFFQSILSFLLNFDRLQFYSYHNRNYSENVRKFLSQIRLLQSIKGSLIETNMRQWFPNYIEEIDLFFAHSEKKMKYINYQVTDEDEKHQSFANYIKYFFTFIMPIIIFIFLLLHIIFHLMRNLAISIVLRPYAFHATLIFVSLQGKLQEIAFHGFGDLRYFFSLTLKHKIINFLSLSILFFAVFTCFGLYLWLRVHYSKKVKIITDSKNQSLSALLSVNFDKGIVIFLLGISHQILLPIPNIQMFILITIEIIWVFKIIVARKLVPYKPMIVVWILQSSLRIYFQITSVFYTNSIDQRITINNQYHSFLIFALMIIICIDIIFNVYFMLKNFYTSQIFRKNSVINSQSRDKKINFFKEHSIKEKKTIKILEKTIIRDQIQSNQKIASLTSKFNLSRPKMINTQNKSLALAIKQTPKSTSTIKNRLRQMKLKTEKNYQGR